MKTFQLFFQVYFSDILSIFMTSFGQFLYIIELEKHNEYLLKMEIPHVLHDQNKSDTEIYLSLSFNSLFMSTPTLWGARRCIFWKIILPTNAFINEFVPYPHMWTAIFAMLLIAAYRNSDLKGSSTICSYMSEWKGKN